MKLQLDPLSDKYFRFLNSAQKFYHLIETNRFCCCFIFLFWFSDDANTAHFTVFVLDLAMYFLVCYLFSFILFVWFFLYHPLCKIHFSTSYYSFFFLFRIDFFSVVFLVLVNAWLLFYRKQTAGNNPLPNSWNFLWMVANLKLL